MRDLVLAVFLIGMIPVALARPIYAVAVYMLISIMNPHQMMWTFAREVPWALIYALIMTFSVLRHHSDRIARAAWWYRWPLLLLLWTGVTTLFAVERFWSMPPFVQFLKIQYGVLLALACVTTAKDVRLLIGVCVASIAVYGVKGMVFMIGTGGVYRVNGPNGSLIGDNNHLALAFAMCVPLLFWLLGQARQRWQRVAVWAGIAGCVFSIFGTYSRGGFLALAVVGAFMLLRSSRRLQFMVFGLPVAAAGLAFMPQAFWERMYSIDDYANDGSAMGRLLAWRTATNIANSEPTGAGFAFYLNYDYFLSHAPSGAVPRAAHSIYFQMLGEHGWLGLALFLAIFAGMYVRILRHARLSMRSGNRSRAEFLRAMQVSLAAYLVGGAFLSVAAWDLAFYLYALTVFVLVCPELRFDAATPADDLRADQPERVPNFGAVRVG